MSALAHAVIASRPRSSRFTSTTTASSAKLAAKSSLAPVLTALRQLAIGPDRFKLSLFVSDEVFYDWAIDRWVRNRFAIGASKVFNKHFTQDFYYLRQNDGVSLPGDLNVLGTTLRFKL